MSSLEILESLISLLFLFKIAIKSPKIHLAASSGEDIFFATFSKKLLNSFETFKFLDSYSDIL